MKIKHAAFTCALSYGLFGVAIAWLMMEDLIHPTKWAFASGTLIFCIVVTVFSIRMAKKKFNEGDKVIYTGKVYDFAYYSQTKGKCVLYAEEESNMQDSFCVNINKVTLRKSQ